MTKPTCLYRCCTQAEEHVVTTADYRREKATGLTQDASCEKGLGASEAESRQTTLPAGRTVDLAGIGARRSTVYYDALQSLPPLRSASLDLPDSMLAGRGTDKPAPAPPPPPANLPRPRAREISRSLSSSFKKSQILSAVKRRSTVVFRQNLEVSSPRVVETRGGFPGHLTEPELEACLQFREQLKIRDEVYREMVGSFAPVESEAYAICRYMRSRKFCVRNVFEMMDGTVDLYLEGKVKNFFPDAEQAVGAPESVLLTQFPLLLGGTAKNGCPISYFDATNIHIEGIECVTSLDNIPNYMWHLIMHKLKDHLAKALADDDRSVVRVQLLLIIDLKGLHVATLNKAMKALEKALKILCVFPEILFCAVVLNAPGFFKFSWGIIKAFLDPDTASKIEIYSNEAEGKRRLLELVDASELASDFGGTATSTADTITRLGMRGQGGGGMATAEARPIRRIVNLISVPANNRRNGGRDFAFDLAKHERVSLAIYSNSKAGADLVLSNGDHVVERSEVVAGGSQVQDTYSVEIGSLLPGPDSYRVSFKSKPLPRETEKLHYFLIVGYVFTTQSQSVE